MIEGKKKPTKNPQPWNKYTHWSKNKTTIFMYHNTTVCCDSAYQHKKETLFELIWLIHFHGHISLLRVFWQSYGILYLNDLQIFADSLMTDNKIQNVSKIVRHTCQSISISLFLLVKQQEWQFKSGRWYLVDRDKISIAMFRLSFYLPTISKQQLFKRYH